MDDTGSTSQISSGSNSPSSSPLRARTKRALTITTPSIETSSDTLANVARGRSSSAKGSELQTVADVDKYGHDIPWRWVLVAMLIRSVLALMQLDTVLYDWIELNVPTTNFKRLIEGLHLIDLGLSPYASPVYVQPPLVLLPFLLIRKFIVSAFPQQRWIEMWLFRFLFIAVDMAIAYILHQIAHLAQQKYFSKWVTLEDDNSDNRTPAGMSPPDTGRGRGIQRNLPLFIAACYLFNPIMIASCASMSTVIFNNLFIAMALLQALRGNLLLSVASVTLATYLTVYPVVLLIPMACIAINLDCHRGRRSIRKLSVIVRTAFYFIFCNAALLYASYSFMGNSWQFIERSFLYPMQAGDLTPNWGNWWYFFTETFDHFRSYFLLAFHAHILAYLVPLTIRLHKDGLFLGIILTAIIALFKPYPTFADVFFYANLLLIYIHLSQNVRYGFFIIVLMIYSMVLGPVFYNTWVYKGTGNANFFYFITLAFLLAQILLIIEFLLAKLKFMGTEKRRVRALRVQVKKGHNARKRASKWKK